MMGEPLGYPGFSTHSLANKVTFNPAYHTTSNGTNGASRNRAADCATDGTANDPADNGAILVVNE